LLDERRERLDGRAAVGQVPVAHLDPRWPRRTARHEHVRDAADRDGTEHLAPARPHAEAPVDREEARVAHLDLRGPRAQTVRLDEPVAHAPTATK
jgi:hypothetical protein